MLQFPPRFSSQDREVLLQMAEQALHTVTMAQLREMGLDTETPERLGPRERLERELARQGRIPKHFLHTIKGEADRLITLFGVPEYRPEGGIGLAYERRQS